MFKGLRFRPVGWLVAGATATAMAATMVVASPGGAAPPEKEFMASFKQECIIGPGSLNQKGNLEVMTRSKGPESVVERQEFEPHESTSTIASPAELGNTLFSLGVRKVRGKVTVFELNGINLSPPVLNIAKPAAFPEGLPYEAPVEQNKVTSFTVPHEGSYSFGPYKVTGAAGSNAELEVNSEPGFKEVGVGEFEATGKGIVSSLEGVNAEGGHVIGPLPVVCTAPKGVILSTLPIGEGPPISTTSSSSTTSSTTSTTTSTTTSAHSTTICGVPCGCGGGGVCPTFENWKLTGSLTDKRQGQKISLPEGCTFNGEAAIPGPLEGRTFCPPFTASLKLFGFLPTAVGLDLTESERMRGSILAAGEGKLTFKATDKENLALTSIGILGLTIPTNCATAEPIVFPLESTAPASSFATGVTFNGETTLPAVQCQGGLLGSLFGRVLTALLSGPNNPFTLAIAP
jgi:hypothetical protein